MWPGHGDVALVDKVPPRFLVVEQRFVKEEEGLLAAHTVHAERALQDELPQVVRSGPVQLRSKD